MAKVLGIEYVVPTLDGNTEAYVLFHENYPVAFESIGIPEIWKEIVSRHKQDSIEGEA